MAENTVMVRAASRGNREHRSEHHGAVYNVRSVKRRGHGTLNNVSREQPKAAGIRNLRKTGKKRSKGKKEF